MSDTLRSGGDIEQQKQQTSPQSPDIIEKQKKLEKLRISVDSEILERIEADAGAKTAFEQDLVVIENNPTEKSRFEQMYVKGFWQIVETQFGNLSFAQIQKHPQRADILKKLPNDTYDAYDDWMENWKKVAIGRKNSELTGEQIAINKNKRLEEMHTQLDSEIKQIQSINWVPKPTPEELKKNAQNIPELKWVPIEEIQSSDKYNNILLADYYVRNATEIGKNLNPQDTKKFRDSINSLSDTLGRPRIEKFETLTKQLVLGENRGKVESMGKELIKSGYSPDVVWNPQYRTMTFSNEKWEKRIIDTAKVPPTERLKNGAIEVSKELEKPKINIYTTERQSSENRMNSLIKNAKDGPVIGAILWSTLLEEWWKKVQEEKNPLERTVLSLETLGNKRRVIKELAKKAEENGEVKEAETLKEALPQIDKQIQDIIAEWQKLAEVSKKEKEEVDTYFWR